MDRITSTDGLAATEAECAAGRTAPRVSLEDINAAIAAQYIFTADTAVRGIDPPVPVIDGLNLLTVCLIVMRNGFIIVGKSAPASPANFDSELGAKLAYEDAVRQIWPLMGFALRDQLFHVQQQHVLVGAEAADREQRERFHPTVPTPQIPMPEGFKQYTGTKTVFARPMTRGEFALVSGRPVADDETADDNGYLVEYTDGLGAANHPDFEGYISWSPQAVFNGAYNPAD